jgi:hypothetical protein
MCHGRSAGSEWRCECGYEFGQSVDKVLVLLRDQQTNARIVLVILLLIDAAAVAGTVYLAATHGTFVVSFLAMIFLIGATARAARKLLITRESLKQIERAALPAAIIHKG